MSNRYTIEIIADAPPRLCLGDVIAGGRLLVSTAPMMNLISYQQLGLPIN